MFMFSSILLASSVQLWIVFVAFSPLYIVILTVYCVRKYFLDHSVLRTSQRLLEAWLHWIHMVVFQVAQCLDHFADKTMAVDLTPYHGDPTLFKSSKNLKENLRKYRKHGREVSLSKKLWRKSPWPHSPLKAFSWERVIVTYEHEARHAFALMTMRNKNNNGKEKGSFFTDMLGHILAYISALLWTAMFLIRVAAWRSGSVLEYRDGNSGELLAVSGMCTLRRSVFIGPYYCRDKASRASIYHDMMKTALDLAIFDPQVERLIVGYSNGGMRRVKMSYFKATVIAYPWEELVGPCLPLNISLPPHPEEKMRLQPATTKRQKKKTSKKRSKKEMKMIPKGKKALSDNSDIRQHSQIRSGRGGGGGGGGGGGEEGESETGHKERKIREGKKAPSTTNKAVIEKRVMKKKNNQKQQQLQQKRRVPQRPCDGAEGGNKASHKPSPSSVGTVSAFSSADDCNTTDRLRSDDHEPNSGLHEQGRKRHLSEINDGNIDFERNGDTYENPSCGHRLDAFRNTNKNVVVATGIIAGDNNKNILSERTRNKSLGVPLIN
eukprot:jgi/Bigna1/70722/fgenesh1_pg.13_\